VGNLLSLLVPLDSLKLSDFVDSSRALGMLEVLVAWLTASIREASLSILLRGFEPPSEASVLAFPVA